MKLSVTDVDYAPEELYEQTPFEIILLRQITGTDRPDYWLGELTTKLKWIDNNHEKLITHVVVAARWEGTAIEPKVDNLPIGISFVIDQTVLNDDNLDFKKCAYVAIGIAHEIEGGQAPERSTRGLAGTIGKFFGIGNSSKNGT